MKAVKPEFAEHLHSLDNEMILKLSHSTCHQSYCSVGTLECEAFKKGKEIKKK